MNLDDITLSKASLKGKVVLITGATGSIGKAVSLECASYGATVLLLSKNLKKLEQLYDDIIKYNYPTPIICPMDLLGANPDDYINLAAQLKSRFKLIDAFISCAGIFPSLAPVEYYSEKNWYNIFQVNFHSNFHLTKVLLPLLKNSKSAKIVFTLPNEHTLNKAFFGAYASANAALMSFIKVTAEELENSNITVTGLYPGEVLSSMRAKIFPAQDFSSMLLASKMCTSYVTLLNEKSKKYHAKSIKATTLQSSNHEKDASKILNLEII